MSDLNENNIPNEAPKSPIDNSTFEVPPQPVQLEQPQFEEPHFEQPHFEQPQFQQTAPQLNNVAPKKSKKKLVGLITAAVGVAACVGVAVFAGPKIIDALSKKSKAAPLDRFKNAITSSFDTASTYVQDAEQKNEFADGNIDATIGFNVNLGEYATSMIPAEYAGIQNVSANMNVVNFNNEQYVNLDLSTPTATALTIEGYVKDNGQSAYIKVPQLSDAYVLTKIEQLLTGTEFSSSPMSQMTPVTPAEMTALLADESKVITDKIQAVEIEEDSEVTASGVTAKYDKLTASLSGTEFGDMVYNCYERLTKEKAFIEFFDMYAASYTDYVPTIEDSLKELKDWSTTNTTGVDLVLYLNDDDEIMGMILLPKNEVSNPEIGFISAKDGDTGFEFYLKDGEEQIFKVDGTYTKSNDAYTGNAKITAYEDGLASSTFEITYKDVSCKDNKPKGSISFTSPELMGLTLSFDYNFEKNAGDITMKVAMAAMDIVTVNINASLKAATSIPSMPADATVFDEADGMESYLSTADLTGFLNNFYTATGIDLTPYLY